MRSNSTATAVGPGSLIPVAVTTLRSLKDIGFDLYLCRSRNSAPQLYREKHFPLTATDIERLLEQGITTVHTPVSEAEHYCEHVRSQVLTDEAIPPSERYCIVNDTARTLLVDSLQSRDAARICNISAQLGQDLVTVICDQKNILGDLFVVMTHDYATYTHAANVCTYSILLAEAYGIHDQSELAKIAQGALLHDLGKSYIPSQILNKKQPLNQREKEVIKQHPVRGFEELCFRKDVSWGQLMMVYQHHERCDGGGYPMGLVGREIHEWGRLCAVVDVFDALTRDRPYRKGAITSDVLEYLDRESGRSFDEDIVQCWIATLQQCQR